MKELSPISGLLELCWERAGADSIDRIWIWHFDARARKINAGSSSMANKHLHKHHRPCRIFKILHTASYLTHL